MREIKNVHERDRELDREGEMSFKCTKPRQTIGQTQRVSLREKKREGEGEGEREKIERCMQYRVKT